MTIFKLPDLGEGLPDAEIREWHVKVGDTIKTDEPLVSMETAKAVVEVPSPQNGIIKKLFGEDGDTVDTGNSLVEFESSAEDNNSTNIEKIKTKSNKKDNSSTVAGKIESSDKVVEDNFIIGSANKAGNNIKATPAVRSLAKKLEVDLKSVSPTGSNNMITAQDVKLASNHSPNNQSNNSVQTAQKTNTISNYNLDSTKTEPLKGVRKAMAAAMSISNREVAAASLFDDADIFAWPAKEDITVRLMRALVTACRAEPSLNALYDPSTNTRLVSENINLGLAVDSKEGLFVPVINNLESVETSNLRDIINTIKSQVEDRTIPQEQLRGNTITLSNIGTVAGKYACPVVVPPTVAILAIGKLFYTPVLNKDNQLENHKNIPVSLTFDHRCVTGGEAARFLKAFIEDLQK